jgi:predicted membrane protein
MKKIVIGVIVVMFGVVLLFKNTGLLEYSMYHLIISWQSLLIAIGAVLLFDKKSDHKTAGAILIVIGALFLISKIFDTNLSGLLIPLILICVGLFFIIKPVIKKSDNQSSFWGNHFDDFKEQPFLESAVDNTGFISREYIFTASKERWTYGKLKRVEIKAVFSGVELDFTQSELSDEVKTVYLKIESVFSGVSLFVPSDWNIQIQKTGVFGGFTDTRPRNIQTNEGKTVVLELEAVFGGGEIKCYE